MTWNGEPTPGDVRYQRGAIATAVTTNDGPRWEIEQDGITTLTEQLAHATHWHETPEHMPSKEMAATSAPAQVSGAVFYPDCSNNNWGSVAALISFLQQLAPQGFAGMCHKVSEGTYYSDPYWRPCLQWCEQNGMPVIGYHYVTTNSPAAQAQRYLAAGGSKLAMLDWEANGGNVANLSSVVNAFNAAGVTVQLGYYPRWYWEGVGGGSLAGLANAVVSSSYPDGSGYASSIYNNSGGARGNGWNSYGNVTPTCWQFTDRANIAGYSVDCNAFAGDAAGLASLFSGGTVTNPTPTLSDVYALLQQVLAIAKDNQTQLRGPGLLGWPQLDGRTLVDALATVGQKLEVDGFTPPQGGNA